MEGGDVGVEGGDRVCLNLLGRWDEWILVFGQSMRWSV